ncbi:hypothetical protein RUM43_005840 [Polyplax serrata]|uniref:Anoctamin n=1 Tax=Polyplax serrata TaxID=468196 RepID=A0AAN8RUZ4_POLSC
MSESGDSKSVKNMKSAEDLQGICSNEGHFRRFSGRSVPSTRGRYDEHRLLRERRSSIPPSLTNYNIHVYNSRRYSEVVLSPTDTIQTEKLRSTECTTSRRTSRISEAFNNFGKRFKAKNQVGQCDYVVSDEEKVVVDVNTWKNEEEVPKTFSNPLDDEIVYENDEFLEEEIEDVEYMKLEDVEQQSSPPTWSSMPNESRRRFSIHDSRQSQQHCRSMTALCPSTFGSPILPDDVDYDKPFRNQRNSNSFLDSRNVVIDVNPSLQSDSYGRFHGRVSESRERTPDNYRNNLKAIVLSYFHLTRPKWDHSNINGTSPWDRRCSQMTVNTLSNNISHDVFGPKISATDNEESIHPAPYNEHDDYLTATNEIEYSSGGLLSVVDEERPDSTPQRPPDSETLLFSDGKRRIDMVLVYVEDHQGVMRESEMLKKERRRVFRENLEREGLEFELEDKKASFDEKTYFLKIHAPWHVMTRYAELMNIKMPIKKDREKNNSTSQNSFLAAFNKFFDYDHKRIPDEPSFYKAVFTRNQVDQFVVKDRESFFTAAQRSQIVWEILMRAKYDSTEKVSISMLYRFKGKRSYLPCCLHQQVGIRRLLNDETFLAAFPLHEGRYDVDGTGGFMFDRRLLYLEWARPAKWYKKQPLWLVRKYFGDKIALYFAWLGFYTNMLTLPAVVGVLCFLYGLGSLEHSDNIPGNEICDAKGAGNLTLCPMCDKACRYIKLGDSCMYAKMTYLFDNPATVFFAIFMSLWATMYLELWKRQQSIIVWEWDLQLVEEDEEPRPEFETSVKTFRINPVTREKEPYLPVWSKALRFLATGATVMCMIFVVVGAVLGTIIYRISIVAVIYSGGGTYLRDHAKIFTSMTAALINLVIIMILTKFYHQLAIWLTNIENPRTQSEYEDSFTFKIFLFEFVNFYSSLIYIAFFKGRFFMYPGDMDARSSQFLKLKGDVCDPAGCLSELCIQLAIIMIGKQCLNNVLELLYPKFWNWWYHRIHYNNTKKDFQRKLTRWEEDYQMQDAGRFALFEEYLEMVLQYGFVTLFVAAFPLAPLFAFLNNIGEIRLDAYKMVTQSRRPLAERVQNIGAWYGILKGLTYAAVVSNAFVIGYTSDFVPRMVYKFVYSPTHDLRGYIRSSLSEFNTSDYTADMGSPDDDPDPPICYYRGYRNPPNHPTDPYDLSPQYWHVFAARLAFVVVFEHFVFALTGIMAYVIPDVPAAVKTQMLRENLLAKEAKYEKGLKSPSGNKEFLSAVKDHDQSKIESILRRGSWGRKFSKVSGDLGANVEISRRKESNSTSLGIS